MKKFQLLLISLFSIMCIGWGVFPLQMADISALLTVYDDFERASLGSNWTTQPSLSACAIIDSSDLTGTSGQDSGCYWNADSFSDAQFSKGYGTVDEEGFAVRMTSSGFYMLLLASPTQKQIYRVDGASFTQLGSNITDTHTDGSLMEVRAVGNRISYYRDGSEIAFRTDTTYASGSPGLQPYSNTPKIEEWWGGNLTAASAGADCGDVDLVCQNFEGTGYDNSESWTEDVFGGDAVIDPDYTTTVLRGSQSLRMAAGSQPSVTYKIFDSAESEIYGFAQIRYSSLSSFNGADLFNSSDVGQTQFVAIILGSGGQAGKLRIAWLGVGDSSDSTTTLSTSTTYYLWWYVKTGTGSNAEAWLKMSTDRFEPSTPEITVTNGTWTIDRMAMYPATQNSSGTDVVYDQFMLSTTPIGDVLE